jgi:hypothetical protein
MNAPRLPRQAITTKIVTISREVIDELTQTLASMPERIRNRVAGRPDAQKHIHRETLTIAIRLETTASPTDIPPSMN